MPGVAEGGCDEGGDFIGFDRLGKTEVNLTPFLAPFLADHADDRRPELGVGFEPVL